MGCNSSKANTATGEFDEEETQWVSCESWWLYTLLKEETMILSFLAPNPIWLLWTIAHASMMIFLFWLLYIVQFELIFVVIYLSFLSYIWKVKYAWKTSVVQNFFCRVYIIYELHHFLTIKLASNFSVVSLHIFINLVTLFWTKWEMFRTYVYFTHLRRIVNHHSLLRRRLLVAVWVDLDHSVGGILKSSHWAQ